ncbi:Propeptide PepSY amd peptidase M4 [Lysobacter dokdonensis DS-58]|uniref:Propeptide PepSY amd peptidase M4 n=1 Tax=Lysobacter dokdonensis DS-58 TaxID=1300345 RepID=A0A0A2WEF9_9GAMM|nr:PepSY domain-containing protein [Lysobacter dokdonensis]KGQ18118.1 Propeptide PepSY amd peptidase M4 [Lysobacter dokdonensis DS-58]
MKRKTLFLLSLALASGVAFAQQPATQPVQAAMTDAQVHAKLEAAGYTNVNDVKFEDGVWKADAKSADGNRVDVRIDAKSGAIYPDEQVANLNEASVKAQLAAAGYTNVHDVDFEDGIWNAEADDPNGKDVEVKIDPKTGQVIGKEKD